PGVVRLYSASLTGAASMLDRQLLGWRAAPWHRLRGGLLLGAGGLRLRLLVLRRHVPRHIAGINHPAPAHPLAADEPLQHAGVDVVVRPPEQPGGLGDARAVPRGDHLLRHVPPPKNSGGPSSGARVARTVLGPPGYGPPARFVS